MKPETKDRLAYALAGGAVIPASFFLLLMWLPGELGGFAVWPLTLQMLVHHYFVPAPAPVEPMFDGLPAQGFWPFVMAGNFILYFLMLSPAIWWKQRNMLHLK